LDGQRGLAPRTAAQALRSGGSGACPTFTRPLCLHDHLGRSKGTGSANRSAGFTERRFRCLSHFHAATLPARSPWTVKGDWLREPKRRLCGAKVPVPVPLSRGHFACTITLDGQRGLAPRTEAQALRSGGSGACPTFTRPLCLHDHLGRSKGTGSANRSAGFAERRFRCLSHFEVSTLPAPSTSARPNAPTPARIVQKPRRG